MPPRLRAHLRRGFLLRPPEQANGTRTDPAVHAARVLRGRIVAQPNPDVQVVLGAMLEQVVEARPVAGVEHEAGTELGAVAPVTVVVVTADALPEPGGA